ncbi:hypothetical protein HGRIS_010663 [Hohenbuehelia grisea]|uniref:Uncharacterized protein n=1 Tax=Hohenbuehelia grisea TaxID=104357 RepID=A0ABR3IXH0_9AGAR
MHLGTLFWLLNVAVAYAQTSRRLDINSVSSFNASSSSSFIVPAAGQLTVSVALCSSSNPRFFVTNASTTSIPSSSGGQDVFEIFLSDGHGNWTGKFDGGGLLAIEASGEVPFEVGVSDNGPMHQALSDPAFLGDTTANQAIIFSYPFAAWDFAEPRYPNYTLPQANLTAPTPPSSAPNFTIFVSTTTSSALNSLPKTGCALNAQRSEGVVSSQSAWLKDESGWREQWILSQLAPSTNYTAFVIQDGTKISRPIMFVTKSATFACPLAASLPYCPGIAYSVPLPAPPSADAVYDASNLPESITEPLISSLTNFTTSLLTFACGRDWYSPIVSCADCQREYRKWLCTISFPRCGEASPNGSNTLTRSSADPSATGVRADAFAQQVLSALVPQPTSAKSRNENFPDMGSEYSVLLPCLETCNAVDRACPSFLGFRCPVRRFNAAASYGVGYIDSGDEDGEAGRGMTGVAQDTFGNIWCNAG